MKSSLSFSVNAFIFDYSGVDGVVTEVSNMFVTEVFVELLILYRAVGVEHQPVYCAVGYSRAHHGEQSSSLGAEYVTSSFNLHESTIFIEIIKAFTYLERGKGSFNSTQ